MESLLLGVVLLAATGFLIATQNTPKLARFKPLAIGLVIAIAVAMIVTAGMSISQA